MKFKKYHLAAIPTLVVLVAAAVLTVVGRPGPATAAAGTQLYLSPASQTVTSGSNLVVSIVLNTGGASVNTVQSVISYSAANYSFVSISPGAAFGSFPTSVSSGSIQFTAGASSPVNGTSTVATLTLHATGTGTSAISLNSSLCGPGNYTLTCTAAYDSSTSNNDLIGATTPIINGSYTVAAAPAPPPPPPSGSGSSGTGSGSSSSTAAGLKGTPSTKQTTTSGSSGSTSTPSSSAPATPTPTTTTTDPAPVISNVKVSNVGSTSAVVTWQTNLPATSVVEYGLTVKYGLTAQATGLATSHKVTLTSPYIVQNTTYYLQVLSATATGASATGGAQQFTSKGFTVTLRIVDQSSKPVKGATVTIDKQTQTTNSNGVVSFQNLPAGKQTVVVKSGHNSTTSTITVGKLDPKTGTYQAQTFALKIKRTASMTPYILAILYVLIGAAITLVILNPGLIRESLARLRRGGGPATNGPGPDVPVSGSSSSSAAPTAPTAPTPSAPVASAAPATPAAPLPDPTTVRVGDNRLKGPDKPQPGAVIEPNQPIEPEPHDKLA